MTLEELYDNALQTEEEQYRTRLHQADLPACPSCGTKSHVHRDGFPLSGDFWCFRCNVSWQTLH